MGVRVNDSEDGRNEDEKDRCFVLILADVLEVTKLDQRHDCVHSCI